MICKTLKAYNGNLTKFSRKKFGEFIFFCIFARRFANELNDTKQKKSYMEHKNAHVTSQPNGWVLTATLPSENIVEVRCRTIKQVAQFIEEHDITLTIGDITY